jgi:hypothetical protein
MQEVYLLEVREQRQILEQEEETLERPWVQVEEQLIRNKHKK